ncbi:MAG: response regulator [Holophagaceae bacterium]|nr:response regulator [Holophagaceae bacterium]
MKPISLFLRFLDRFSLRHLLMVWMAVALAGCSATLLAYWRTYQHLRIPAAGAADAGAGYLFAALAVAGLSMTGILGLAISRSVARQVQGMAELAQRLEMRDFKDYPVAIPDGEPGKVIRSFLDMRRAIIGYETELRTAVDQLREANHNLGQREAFLRALVDSAPVGILTQDRDSVILSINPFLQELLGYGAEEVVGKDPAAWLDPQDAEAFYGRLSGFYGKPVGSGRALHEAMVALGPFPPQELNFIRKDGAKVPVMVAVSLMQGNGNGSLGRLTVVTDLTVLKALEMGLREREAEAQAANRAKSAFLAAMSHEVRTPLIGINGMIEILSMGTMDKDQRQAVNIIHHSAQSLLQIVGDILDFSKVEAGKLELVPETISIRKVIETAVTNFAQAASSKGLQIHREISDAVGPAHVADPLRLIQILNNFLSNAVKFTKEGSITVRVRRVEATAGAEKLRLEVQDTGIGVPEENQVGLFQPFSQAESSTTRRFGGTGLGLAISRRLADLMGGEISMQSAPGRGTLMAFTATFPLGDVKDIVEAESLDLREVAGCFRPTPSVEEAVLERSLILLAEDHPTNRAVLTRQLNLAGFALEVAEDGLDAFERWKSGRHALVLTDLHMPRMDGYQLTEALRNWERAHGLSRTPVIALTANVLQGEAERCLALDMDDYLTKPVSLSMLSVKVRQWLPHLRWPGADPEELEAPAAGELQPLGLDHEALLALSGNDPATATEILEDFRFNTRMDLETLTQYFELKDQDSVVRQAHRIKGASAMVGAHVLAQKARDLESSARAGAWGEVQSLMHQLQWAFEGTARTE